MKAGHPVLPDVGGIARVPTPVWRAFGQRLRDAGFGPVYLDPLAGSGHPADTVLSRSLRIRAHRLRGDAQSLVERLFGLSDPVALDAVSAWLGVALLDRLLDAGLLEFLPGNQLVSPFDLRVYRGLLLLCDDLASGGDAVFGVGPGTAAFVLPSRPQLPMHSALDLGCGAGAVALWVAGRVPRVVGSDVNPRALVFAQANAAINGIDGIEWRQGDLFEAVGDEAYDWIGAQLPYVPWPGERPLGRGPAAYLHAGRRGDELQTRLLEELASHLSACGRAQLVFDQPLGDPSSGASSIWPFSPAGASTLQALVLIGAPLTADDYSQRQALPTLASRGLQAFDAEVAVWRDHMTRLGYDAVSPAIAVLDAAPPGQAWHAVIRAGQALWNQVGAQTLDRLHVGQDWLQRRARARTPRVQLPRESLLVRPLSEGAQEAIPWHLGLPPDYLFGSVALTERQLELLQGLAAGSPASGEEAGACLALAASRGLIDA